MSESVKPAAQHTQKSGLAQVSSAYQAQVSSAYQNYLCEGEREKGFNTGDVGFNTGDVGFNTGETWASPTKIELPLTNSNSLELELHKRTQER